MINLYFNTLLTNEAVHGKDLKLVPSFFHSGFNPDNFFQMGLSNVDKLILSINSLVELNFDTAIFNISVPDKIDEERINVAINNSVKANNLFVNWSRPSTKNEWIEDIRQYLINNKKDNPFIIYMNHDHPFRGEYSREFQDDIATCFDGSNENEVLLYSHIPEGLEEIRKISPSNSSPIRKKVRISQLDSHYIMRLSTLLKLFERMVTSTKDTYIGRLDWGGTYIKSIDVNKFIPQKPYFYHLDGYLHVNGFNIEAFLLANEKFISAQGESIKYLFSIWLEHYYIYLSSVMTRSRNPRIFRKELINCLEHFLSFAKNSSGEIVSDLDSKKLKSLVFSLFNLIYQNIYINLLTTKKGWRSFSALIPFHIRRKILNLLNK